MDWSPTQKLVPIEIKPFDMQLALQEEMERNLSNLYEELIAFENEQIMEILTKLVVPPLGILINDHELESRNVTIAIFDSPGTLNRKIGVFQNGQQLGTTIVTEFNLPKI